ncbi:TATA box-binding protein-associated factor RNA polymerase I subunit B isoform X2 [Alexandromys fortis]|uniref:TATA box-binding protein-associated factor RNA polymerase I subunit B isoform X2 n=1 Tax=Alexandromys fortis TaxID=100897 RepID=UPI002153194B|nr:TATA box-binding protein-associated factor RNA polymerase I subunit B isoform X2 [Microtus fortis]
MDLEQAKSFTDRCSQCAAVSWGLTDEGKYYCTSCHNVTDRSEEVVSTAVIPNTKINSICRGLRKRSRHEKGWDWYVCEGFQCILYHQAEALKTLGVGPELKVLEDNQQSSDWASELELLSDTSYALESGAEFQSEPQIPKPFPVTKASPKSEAPDVCSGSVDGVEYSEWKEKGVLKMTVPRTLALCSLSLLWQRETITLSDLLRFVEEDRIPYRNAFQLFPEEMKVYGRDKGIFAIESWPDYEDIYKNMIEVAIFLDLPRFPDITEDCYLHPNVLCMKYLLEFNLPDEMHSLTCQVVKLTGIGEVDFLTFDPIAKKKRTVKYDVQAVAVIVVVLKLLFLLDDKLEWSYAGLAETYNEEHKEDKPQFDFRKWYQVMKKTFDEKRRQWEEARAKYYWKTKRPIYRSHIDKSVAYKRREMVKNLQKQFSALLGTTPVVEKKAPSSFQFSWTEGDTDSPCFHGHSLQGLLITKGQSLITKNSLYWLSTQKFCKSYCKHVTTYEESNFSLSYQFILNIFSFLLRIKTSVLHEEVSLIEKNLFEKKYNESKRRSRPKKVRRH